MELVATLVSYFNFVTINGWGLPSRIGNKPGCGIGKAAVAVIVEGEVIGGYIIK